MAKLASTGFRTALLHQAAPLPAINGVVKSMKPGGYADGCADIAYALQTLGETIITPTVPPDPSRDLDWSFPDTVGGIQAAVERGANVLWANSHLHSQHAIVQLRDELIAKNVKLVGQNPSSSEKFDDKEWTNRWLAAHPQLQRYFPRSLLYRRGDGDLLTDFPLPAVVKPVRGRGSHGVIRVTTLGSMREAVDQSLRESNAVLIEQYLADEEITVTVMPPGEYSVVGTQRDYWALPVVTRFDQIDGIAPWNGTVPVSQNSRVLSSSEHDADPAYALVQSHCALVAKLCKASAAVRIDCRRSEAAGPFYLFDINFKPNAGGPGRPGRDSQSALTTMAAGELGWDWTQFAGNLLRTARPVVELLRSEEESCRSGS